MARARKSTVGHGERYTCEELWSAADKRLTDATAALSEARTMRRLASDNHCLECTVLIEIPLTAQGERILGKAYATHELGCSEHWEAP